jgi:hypothetical protein
VIDKVTIFQDKYHSKHTINGLFINLFSVIDKVAIFQVKGSIVIYKGIALNDLVFILSPKFSQDLVSIIILL